MKIGQTPLPDAYLLGDPYELCSPPAKQQPLVGASLLGDPYDICIQPTLPPPPPPPAPPPYTPGPCSAALPSIPVVRWDVQTFLTGTWTWIKPAHAIPGVGNCVVDAVGPGGPGGGANGQFFGGLVLLGGGSGGGGKRARGSFDPASLPSTVAVSVPAPGTPGLGAPIDPAWYGVKGGPATAGADSDPCEFGTVGDDWYVTAPGGHGGDIGNPPGGLIGPPKGYGGGETEANHAGTGDNGGGANAGADCGAAGGGDGGGLTHDGILTAGLSGGSTPYKAGGTGGTNAPNPFGLARGDDGLPGETGDVDYAGSGGGGGGAGNGSSEGGDGGGDGADGGFPGGGGGGGGGCGNPHRRGGNGGRGGGGVIRVTTACSA